MNSIIEAQQTYKEQKLIVDKMIDESFESCGFTNEPAINELQVFIPMPKMQQSIPDIRLLKNWG